MPQLTEAVEPAHTPSVTPWWRGVELAQGGRIAAMTWPKALPFPLD